MIINQKLPAVTQNWMRWSTDKSVGLSFNFFHICVFSTPFPSSQEKGQKDFFSWAQSKKMDCAVCLCGKWSGSGTQKIIFFPIFPLLCFIRKRCNSQTGLACCCVTALLAIAGRAPGTSWSPETNFFREVSVYEGLNIVCSFSPVLFLASDFPEDVLVTSLLLFFVLAGWQWCLHIKRWEVSRVMFPLLSLTPWLFLLLT